MCPHRHPPTLDILVLLISKLSFFPILALSPPGSRLRIIITSSGIHKCKCATSWRSNDFSGVVDAQSTFDVKPLLVWHGVWLEVVAWNIQPWKTELKSAVTDSQIAGNRYCYLLTNVYASYNIRWRRSSTQLLNPLEYCSSEGCSGSSVTWLVFPHVPNLFCPD